MTAARVAMRLAWITVLVSSPFVVAGLIKLGYIRSALTIAAAVFLLLA